MTMQKSNIRVRWRNAKYVYNKSGKKIKFGNGLDAATRQSHPIVAIVEARHNDKPVHVNHCVCFVDHYVFDPNMTHAMPVNKKNMDLICQNIIAGSQYIGIKWSRLLYFAKSS